MAAVVGIVGLMVPVGTADAAGGGSKFQNGSWNLFFSATLKCQPQQGQLGIAGKGSFEVLKGNVNGTFEAAGPGHCAITTPVTSITYDGTYAWQKGALTGLATEPQLSATSHFDGTITSSSPAGSGTQSESTDNGPVTAKLVINDANAKTVFGEVVVNNDSMLSSNFFATRNCPAKGPVRPLFDKHIPNGTPDNPTRVNVVSDPAVANVPQLQSAVNSTIENWNNMLEAAGKHIVFGTTPGNGPTIYVGIDSEAFRNSVAAQTGTPALGAMPQSQAGHADDLGNTPGSSFAFGSVRLGTESGGKMTWADYAQTHEENVVGILTHEFGHIVGLSHEPTDKDSLMYPDNQSTRAPTAGCSDLRALAQL